MSFKHKHRCGTRCCTNDNDERRLEATCQCARTFYFSPLVKRILLCFPGAATVFGALPNVCVVSCSGSIPAACASTTSIGRINQNYTNMKCAFSNGERAPMGCKDLRNKLFIVSGFRKHPSVPSFSHVEREIKGCERLTILTT